MKYTEKKDKIFNDFIENKITGEEYSTRLAKLDEDVVKRSKYTKGKQITSLDELHRQEIIYVESPYLKNFRGRDFSILNRGWFLSYQFNYLANLVYTGKVYEAKLKEKK